MITGLDGVCGARPGGGICRPHAVLRLKGPSGFLVGDRCAAASVSRTRPEPDHAG